MRSNATVGAFSKRTSKVSDLGVKLGDKFGKLTVIADGYDLPMPNGTHKPQYLCECSCPKHTLLFVTTTQLNNGSVRSCGCTLDEQATQVMNGYKLIYETKMTPELAVRHYNLIYDRCYSPQVVGYHNHYGAGIELCPRWKDPVNGLRNFYEDMAPTFIPCHEVERYDRTKNYSPENCYWCDVKKIKYDKRPSKNTFEYDGCNFAIKDWARLLGVNMSLIYCRITIRGWTNPEDILFGKCEVGFRGYRAPRNAIYYLTDNNQPNFDIDPSKDLPYGME